MKKIEEIDKNFTVKAITAREHTRAYDVRNAPFSIHGLIPPQDSDGLFCRLPLTVAARVSENVTCLSTHCAGGRVRFRTDSQYIAVYAEMGHVGKMPHFAMTGSAGFDLYADREYIGTFIPKFDMEHELIGERTLKEKRMREYTLNFPLYSEVKSLAVILDEDAQLAAAGGYQIEKPVVFYGSSITQGGCASRSGTSYPAILSRRLHMEYLNLGFSGSAKGEDAMANYIAGLDMIALVYDYDHNASTDCLRATHERFLQTVRAAHPTLPIICMTQPIPSMSDYKERKKIIQASVLNAEARGDRNVYYLDMSDYLKKCGVLDEASVDKCHPNDLGFYFMAQAVEEVLKRAFKREA